MSERLEAALRALVNEHGDAAIAVSGGVDSMTLSSFTHRRFGPDQIRMIHAVSPAVPAVATERVRDLAAAEAWRLDVIDAGEFADERYRSNPVNRCFFCKTNLYQSLSAMTDGVVLSGTNTDDLGDYRPGLQAAKDHAVRHPYVEAGLAKSDVRALAAELGLPELAKLPASPCLASRVETGLRITAPELIMIDAVESWLRGELRAKTVRCRLRPGRLVIELAEQTLATLSEMERHTLISDITARFPDVGSRAIEIAEYRQGSAFLHPGQATPVGTN